MLDILSCFSKEQLFVICTDWCYLCSLYFFMGAFFNTKDSKNRIIEIISYFLATIYFSISYLFFNYLLSNIISNIVIIFLLSLNYKGKFGKRISLAVIFYLTNALIEICIFGFNRKIHLFASPEGTLHIAEILIVRIIELFIAVLVHKLGNIRKGEKLPKYYWVTIILIPVINLLFGIMLSYSHLSYFYFTLFSFFLLIEDVFIIFLFDKFFELQKKSEEAIISDLQNESYRKQLEIINGSLQATKVMRHDMKNQMLTVQGLLEAKDYESALEHIKTMTGTWATVNRSINTGNVEVDSLINFKLSQARQSTIDATTNICIPEHLKLRSFDMATIVGNLFDNSFDALKNLSEEERKLSLAMKYSKGRIFISFENPYTGIISWKNGIPVTKKKHEESHGVGLQEISSTVARYNGQITFSVENNLFKVTVMMYDVVIEPSNN